MMRSRHVPLVFLFRVSTSENVYTAKPPLRDRIGACLFAAIVVALIGWSLVAGLAFTRRVTEESIVEVFTLELPSLPPAAVVPDRKPSPETEGRAAPPNIRSQSVEVVAPPPTVPVPPSPVATAPIADAGRDATSGAAVLPGPGQGAGGTGDGRGSGGAGDGTGGGLRPETPPRRIKGRLSFSDAARVADSDGLIGRAMTTQFFVEPNGRVSGCIASRSSGLPEVDTEICRLMEERFRYLPARDAAGRPVRARVAMDHSWNEWF